MHQMHFLHSLTILGKRSQRMDGMGHMLVTFEDKNTLLNRGAQLWAPPTPCRMRGTYACVS